MPTHGVGEVIIAKHRNGSLDTIQLKFIGKFTKFMDLDVGGFGDQYGNTFPGAGGTSSFESSAKTMTFGSKINDPESNSPDSKDDDGAEGEEAPF